MRPEEVLAEARREPLADLPKRDSAGVGRDDRLRLAQRFDLLPERAFYFQILCDSASKLPVAIMDAEESTKNAPGRCLMAVSTPFAAACAEMSSRTEEIPAFAKWAAIREPIVPAPRTATRRIVRMFNPFWSLST
jgi:hypothetical protein